MPYKNPSKQKEAQHQHYLNNKEKYKDATTRTRKRTKDWLDTIKEPLSCIKCGEKRNPCLDFHHRDSNDKEMSITHMVKRYSKKRILEEISKCDVLCANCHRIEHWELQNAPVT